MKVNVNISMINNLNPIDRKAIYSECKQTGDFLIQCAYNNTRVLPCLQFKAFRVNSSCCLFRQSSQIFPYALTCISRRVGGVGIGFALLCSEIASPTNIAVCSSVCTLNISTELLLLDTHCLTVPAVKLRFCRQFVASLISDTE